MTIREIVWTLSADGRSITPNMPQDGGQQGEHNVTKVIFNIPVELAPDGTQLYIGCVDCTGGYDKSPVLTVENGQVTFLLPRAWTQFGGTSVLTLTEEGADAIAYAAKARVVYHSRQTATREERRLLDGFMQAACDAAAESAERARENKDTAVAAANTAAAAATKATAAANTANQYAEQAAEMAQDVAGDLSETNQHREAAEAAAGESTAAAEDAAISVEEARLSAASADDSATRAESAATGAAVDAATANEHRQNAGSSALAAAASASNAANQAESARRYSQSAQDAATDAATSAKEAAAAAESLSVDDVLDANSTNPIQNKVVFDALKSKSALVVTLYEDGTVSHNGGSIRQHAEAGGYVVATDGLRWYTLTNTFLEYAIFETTNRSEIYTIQVSGDGWGKATTKLVTPDDVNVVNVFDYGAIGDGEEDDTEAIQKALHVAERKGVPLYFPAGNYLVSKTISTYTRDTDADKQSKALHIFGSGMNTVFTTTEDFEGDYVFHIDVAKAQPRMLWVHDFAIDLVADVSGIYFNEIGMKAVVENLWITHLYDKEPTDTNVRAGIYCRMSTCTTFQRIKVYGNRKSPGEGHENIGIVCEGTYSTKFIDCDIIFCKWAIYLSGGSNNLIEYCRIDENEYGVYQNTTAPTINYMPETRAYPADGEKFKGTARNLTIRNNRFESNNQQAIFLAAYSYGEMNYMYNAQVTIANNDFSGLGKNIAFQTSSREVFRKAIWLYQCKGVVIENNCFSGQPYDESVEDTRLQNLVGERIEDITLRGNVAITKPIWYDDDSHTIEKSNPVLSVEFVNATDFIPDIEADQCSRYSLGDVSLALDSILAIQEELLTAEPIAFTIGGTVYQAEGGMTWAEWCGSEYNTGGYYAADELVYAENGDHVGYKDTDGQQHSVSPSDEIGHRVAYLDNL